MTNAAAPVVSTIATAVWEAVSEQQRAEAVEIGGRFARSNFERADCARSFALILGTNPSFEAWTTLQNDWKAGYRDEHPDNTDNAADAAWHQTFAKLLEMNHGLTKPKSSTPEATKKQTQREKKRAETLAAFADKPTQDLQDGLTAAFTKLAENPDNKAAAAAAKNLQLVLRERLKEARKAESAEIAELRKEARSRIGRCDNVGTLIMIVEELGDWADDAE